MKPRGVLTAVLVPVLLLGAVLSSTAQDESGQASVQWVNITVSAKNVSVRVAPVQERLVVAVEEIYAEANLPVGMLLVDVQASAGFWGYKEMTFMEETDREFQQIGSTKGLAFVDAPTAIVASPAEFFEVAFDTCKEIEKRQDANYVWDNFRKPGDPFSEVRDSEGNVVQIKGQADGFYVELRLSATARELNTPLGASGDETAVLKFPVDVRAVCS